MSTMTAERAARIILARNGAPQPPHPDLLADTIREVEYHGIPADVAAADEPPGWHVARNDYQVPCEHIACDLIHRHLYNAPMDRTLIEVYDMHGNHIDNRWEDRHHMRTVRQWSVINPEGYAVESYDTKREAMKHLPREDT
jgi:hypothetical protein